MIRFSDMETTVILLIGIAAIAAFLIWIGAVSPA